MKEPVAKGDIISAVYLGSIEIDLKSTAHKRQCLMTNFAWTPPSQDGVKKTRSDRLAVIATKGKAYENRLS